MKKKIPVHSLSLSKEIVTFVEIVFFLHSNIRHNQSVILEVKNRKIFIKDPIRDRTIHFSILSKLTIKFKFPVFLRSVKTAFSFFVLILNIYNFFQTSKLNMFIFLDEILLEKVSIPNEKYDLYFDKTACCIDVTYLPVSKHCTLRTMNNFFAISRKTNII